MAAFFWACFTPPAIVIGSPAATPDVSVWKQGWDAVHRYTGTVSQVLCNGIGRASDAGNAMACVEGTIVVDPVIVE